MPIDDDRLSDADRCLLRSSALLALSQPDAAGYLQRRANLSGWYRYWFSLHGSQLYYYDVASDDRRGLLQGTISLFRNQVTVSSSSKRPRELDLIDFSGKSHTLRAEADAQLHWWIHVFAIARNKIPPAKPFKPVQLLMPPSQLDLLQPIQTSLPQSDTPSVRSQNASKLWRRSGSTPSLLDFKNIKSAADENKPCNSQPAQPEPSSSFDATPASVPRSNDVPRLSSTAPSSPGSADAVQANPFPSSEALPASLNEPGPAGNAASEKAARLLQAVAGDSNTDSNIAPRQTSTLSRGGPVDMMEDHLPVDHVLCVVHGIGASDDVLTDNIRMLQESYTEIATKIFPDLNFRVELLIVRWRNALTKLDVHKKLQSVVPIAPSMSGESNPLRQFMVHRIVDYVYYTHDRYRKHILREVVAQLNAQMAEFRRRRPDFDGHCSVFAHSLGAALCYELLCRKVFDDQALLAAEGLLIDFDVANLFMAGSPLGTFLHLDQSLAHGVDVRKLPFRLYNIFHPNDPLGTRIEPYIEPRFVGVHPIEVPYWCNMGTRSSTTQWLGTLWSSSTSKKASETAPGCPRKNEHPCSSEDARECDISPKKYEENGNAVVSNGNVHAEKHSPKTKNEIEDWEIMTFQPSAAQIGIGTSSLDSLLAGSLGRDKEGDMMLMQYFPQAAQDDVIASASLNYRYDFVLQLSSAIEEVSTSWSALRAHTDYWCNRDIMLLILSSMLKTSHGIPDNVSRHPSVELDSHIIDSQMHLKPNRFGSKWMDDGDSRRSILRVGDDAGLARFGPVRPIERLMVSPNDKMSQSNGVAHRNAPSNIPQGAVDGIAVSHASSNSAQGAEGQGTTPGGWASYLPWFTKEKGDVATAPNTDEQNERSSGQVSNLTST